MAIGVVHAASTPLVYPESVASIIDGGVLFSIERVRDLVPLRGIGFWYATAGIGVVLLGAAVRHLEVRDGRVPRWLGWGLLGLTAFGGVMTPASGFWAFLVPAGLSWWSNRRRSAGSRNHARRRT